eukprot:COSAG02_NODE_2336_length_9114_cov_4.097615_5_plen_81_part_00
MNQLQARRRFAFLVFDRHRYAYVPVQRTRLNTVQYDDNRARQSPRILHTWYYYPVPYKYGTIDLPGQVQYRTIDISMNST